MFWQHLFLLIQTEFHLNIEAATSFDDVSGTIGVLVLEDDVASQKN